MFPGQKSWFMEKQSKITGKKLRNIGPLVLWSPGPLVSPSKLQTNLIQALKRTQKQQKTPKQVL